MFKSAIYGKTSRKNIERVWRIVCGECVCIATGEGEGVRGVMLHSFLAVAGDDGTDKLSSRKKFNRREEKKNVTDMQHAIMAVETVLKLLLLLLLKSHYKCVLILEKCHTYFTGK